MCAGQLVTVKAKVIQLGKPNEIWANKSKLTMVEGTVTHTTGNIRLIIQEHLISRFNKVAHTFLENKNQEK